MSDVLVVLTTVPDADSGARIATTLVGERLAACVNVVPAIRSIYRFEGRLCDDAEALLIAKIRKDRLPAYSARMIALHPYQVPEIVALEPSHVAEPYRRFCLEE